MQIIEIKQQTRILSNYDCELVSSSVFTGDLWREWKWKDREYEAGAGFRLGSSFEFREDLLC